MLAKLARSTVARSSRSFVTSSSVSMSDQFNKHRHTDDNNDDTPFEFTPENMRKVETVLGKYPDNYKQRYVDVLCHFSLHASPLSSWFPTLRSRVDPQNYSDLLTLCSFFPYN